MTEKILRSGVPAWVAAALLIAGAAAADVSVHDAWVAETPPGAQTAAAYLMLHNAGDAAVEVVGAESPLCERVELHTTDMSDGVARMRKQDSLRVPAGGMLQLEPGGTHLMLIRPEPLSKGGTVPITIELSTGVKLSVDAPVKARESQVEMPAGHEHEHQH
jgi:copper(I)-binding protein